MILEKEKIHRYMRHIIMPEIGGMGQKKLLESSILIYSDHLSNSALMLYYIAAMGIGKIHCCTKDALNRELILQNLQSLNPDVEICISDTPHQPQAGQGLNYDAVIVFCEKAEMNFAVNSLKNIPIILTATAGDCGYLKSITQRQSLSEALAALNSFYLNNDDQSETLFHKACTSLLGTLAAIEVVKALLDIGSLCENALQFNLASLDLAYGESQLNSYTYALNYEQTNKQLKEAKVLIVGSGGLGSPAAYMLAAMGIGKLGLVDYDTVEISNLNRQILHATDKLGMAKVKSAEEFLKRLNPQVEICTYKQKFSTENAEELLRDYDIILDGLDNLPTRYLLNDVCYFLKKPLIEAGVLGFNGLATAIRPDIGPCYRCIFPESTDNSPIPSCSETGVLGAVPGVMGIIQSVEVLKYLTGIGIPLVNKILMLDSMNLDITILEIYKEPSCALCGKDAVIHELQDYDFFCSDKNLK
ncbi:MAG: UBA/THIF-type binding protein [Clostridia bacterium]|nr:UBA/THIF-type binding protein [Clostridia bacterium]